MFEQTLKNVDSILQKAIKYGKRLPYMGEFSSLVFKASMRFV